MDVCEGGGRRGELYEDMRFELLVIPPRPYWHCLEKMKEQVWDIQQLHYGSGEFSPG